jgi:hypothetical protein
MKFSSANVTRIHVKQNNIRQTVERVRCVMLQNGWIAGMLQFFSGFKQTVGLRQSTEKTRAIPVIRNGSCICVV